MDGTSPHSSPLTRRTFLAALGAAAGSTLVPVAGAQAAGSGPSLTGRRSVSTAMHVHASWSEGVASWEAQFTEATSLGVDLLCMTDHDHRMLAYKYLVHLGGARLDPLSSGAAAARDASRSGGSLHLRVESAGSAPATSGLEVERRPQAVNRLRTNIAGTTLRHTFGVSRLDPGTTYEVVVGLSHHPAGGGRPAGELSLRYRFGDLARGRLLEDRGLVGVVTAPAPPAGTVEVLALEQDARALWPDIFEIDNGFVSLAFVVTSPHAGAVADVSVQDVEIVRTESDAASVVRNQRRIIDTYAPRFPGLVARPDVEVSQQEPHVNVFGVPQFLPNQADTTPARFEAYYPQMIAGVHRDGGVVSYNHPFGADGGPVLSRAAQDDKRRAVFSKMWADDLYGCDLLEVGYQIRGQVNIDTHLALWDTFSRRARFLTGNGANDDHNGKNWAGLGNGFATGIWAASTGNPDVMAALRGGRAYAKHLGTWSTGEIDLLVDGTVPMGKADVSSAGSRMLAVYVGSAPTGGVVQLVQGVVDGAGQDPKTFVLDTIPASAFTGGSGTVLRQVDTTTSCFVRAQVRNQGGRIIGIGNPVWLLREPPAHGIPGARQA